ncbi:hypothetical protein AB0K00_15420 [Dactylosporangium sp. NPDC049525]|uniref:hypothetical protein n=1 Tax=Dactylosporangium sp. NPDC049525 TaxID=3154730 RepID=UPI003437A16B
MGLWIAYALTRSAALPDDLGGWVVGSGTAEGWSVHARRTADASAPPWSAVPGPMLTATVMDSDVALLVGWHDGQERFRWLFNQESGVHHGFAFPDEEPDEATQAAQRAPVVAAMLGWMAEAGVGGGDGGRLDDILSRGYVYAEDGLYAALSELAVTPPGTRIETPRLPSVIAPDSGAPAPSAPPVRPEPLPLTLANGDASVLPEQQRYVYLAAALDHTRPAWDAFVTAHELECWGRPGCLIARSSGRVDAGGLAGHKYWSVLLGSEPPIDLPNLHQLGHAPSLPVLGRWHVAPQELTDPAAVAAWARANVAADVEPPSPSGDTAYTEEAAGWQGLLLMRPEPTTRLGEPVLACELYTYADLVERSPEVAAWLAEARRALVDPVVAALGERAPYGVTVQIEAMSTKGRWSQLPGDAASWEQALTRLRAGQLHFICLEVRALNGEGRESRYRGGIRLTVQLRDPTGHPATISFHLGRSLLGRVGGDVLGLARSAAVMMEAATGHVHAGTNWGRNSPFEMRRHAPWQGQRLDAMTRGVHWGNLVGPGHLAAVGDLRRLLADGRIARLEQWSVRPELWWFELSADPFEPRIEQADLLADALAPVMPG